MICKLAQCCAFGISIRPLRIRTGISKWRNSAQAIIFRTDRVNFTGKYDKNHQNMGYFKFVQLALGCINYPVTRLTN